MMNERFNLIGKQFSNLMVLELIKERTNSGHRQWLCRCFCGKELIVSSDSLRTGNTTSCGCIRLKDIAGKKFSRLTAVKRLNKFKNNRASIWECKCDCGNITEVNITKLLSGHTKSCGCLLREKARERCIKYNVNYRLSKGKCPTIPIEKMHKILWNKYKKSGLIEKTLARDNFICQLCNKKNDSFLQVHHIIPISHDDSKIMLEKNLITLCHSCHKLAHNGNWKCLNSDIQIKLTNIVEEK